MKLHTLSRRGALLTLTLALTPLALAQPRGRDHGQYRILQARYGTPRRNVDVTPRLRELARSDQAFRVSNNSFGVDPDEGRVKRCASSRAARTARPAASTTPRAASSTARALSAGAAAAGANPATAAAGAATRGSSRSCRRATAPRGAMST